MKLKTDERELDRLARALEGIISSIPPRKHLEFPPELLPFETRARRRQTDFWSPAELLVAAALVNRNRWNPVVSSRLKLFRSEHRGVKSIADLRRMLGSMDDEAVYTRVLHFGSGKNPKNYRAPLLRGLADAFEAYRRNARRSPGKTPTDYEILRAWAREPNPSRTLRDAIERRIPGLGPKLVEWLRMYGGDLPTVPADVYTARGMKKLGLDEIGKTAEFLARLFRLSPYTLDMAFRHGDY